MKIVITMGDDNTHIRIKNMHTVFQVSPFTDDYPKLSKDIIPEEWQNEIRKINKKEQEVIKERQALMRQYKKEFNKVLSDYIKDHPEHFI